MILLHSCNARMMYLFLQMKSSAISSCELQWLPYCRTLQELRPCREGRKCRLHLDFQNLPFLRMTLMLAQCSSWNLFSYVHWGQPCLCYPQYHVLPGLSWRYRPRCLENKSLGWPWLRYYPLGVFFFWFPLVASNKWGFHSAFSPLCQWARKLQPDVCRRLLQYIKHPIFG